MSLSRQLSLTAHGMLVFKQYRLTHLSSNSELYLFVFGLWLMLNVELSLLICDESFCRQVQSSLPRTVVLLLQLLTIQTTFSSVSKCQEPSVFVFADCVSVVLYCVCFADFFV